MKLTTPLFCFISLAMLGTTSASATVYSISAFTTAANWDTSISDLTYAYDSDSGSYVQDVDKINALSFEADPFGVSSIKITLNDIGTENYTRTGDGTESSPYVYSLLTNNWTWALEHSGAISAEATAISAGAKVMAIDVTTVGASYVGAPSIVFYSWSNGNSWAQDTFTAPLVNTSTYDALKSTIYYVIPDSKATEFSTDAGSSDFLQWISAMATPSVSGETTSIYYSNLRLYDTLWEDVGIEGNTWYGDVLTYSTGSEWIWSYDNGSFQYADGTSPASMYIYDKTIGWMWTAYNVYPYYYVFSSGLWAYYYTNSTIAENGTDNRLYFTWLSDGKLGWTDAAGLVAGTLTTEYTEPAE